MSHWTQEEKQSFFGQALGQIHAGTTEGRFIQQLLYEKVGSDIQTIVEIGTWNGCGSTLCILNAIQDQQGIPFYSLECCKEKQEAAITNLESLTTQNTHLIWGTVVDTDRIQQKSYLQQFTDVYEPWYKTDLQNCLETPNVVDMLPEQIDFLLLDGGEYTTLNEFEILFPRCKHYILLDDTRQSKCARIEALLSENSEWERIFHSSERAGFSCWQKLA